MKILRSVWMIINYKTLIVAALALVSTYLCDLYGIKAEYPLTLVAIAIVFPVVFSIDSAYKRRERALSWLGDMKAHMTSLYLAARDWEGANDHYKDEVQVLLIDFYKAVSKFLIHGNPQDEKRESKIFKKVSKLSIKLQEFRHLGLQVGEISRVNQYVSKILVDVENIKMILKYRTPVTLRAYSKIFIYSFPVLYGPYFVAVSETYSPMLEYVMPLLFSFILVSLDNIQFHLENPFDQVGEDDIKFDEKEIRILMGDRQKG